MAIRPYTDYHEKDIPYPLSLMAFCLQADNPYH